MQPLEKTIKDARDTAESAAQAALEQLGVGEATPFVHLSDQERELRRKLRVHGRQLGDLRNAVTETQEIFRLIEEVAYEHWHRMLFARFLAENNLLMYPDPDDPVAVTLEECEDIAADEGAANGWELAARFAARLLPQIFRLDSPAFQLTLPPEHQQKLEQLIAALPLAVFTAADILGWVYQFWQAKKKDEVNASEVKIGARELPAVTQLFTELYMVSFLLDNSLGAWWAARRLSEKDVEEVTTEYTENAEIERELRRRASIPGVPLEYLRFVKEDPRIETDGDGLDTEKEDICVHPCSSVVKKWVPAAGTFAGWPDNLAELKTLDPCCGSGHFLVAAFLMLVPIRIERENLTAQAAVDAVLRENIHGLELDQRCVELAAFALALTAWKYPEAGGYRILPELNIACSGLSVSLARKEWRQLGLGKKNLAIALGWLHDTWNLIARLGPHSFQTPMWDFNVQLITLSRGDAVGGQGELFAETKDRNLIRGVDVSEPRTASEKAAELLSAEIKSVGQAKQLEHPNAVIVFEDISGDLLQEIASSHKGLETGDWGQFRRLFWEIFEKRRSIYLLES